MCVGFFVLFASDVCMDWLVFRLAYGVSVRVEVCENNGEKQTHQDQSKPDNVMLMFRIIGWIRASGAPHRKNRNVEEMFEFEAL